MRKTRFIASTLMAAAFSVTVLGSTCVAHAETHQMYEGWRYTKTIHWQYCNGGDGCDGNPIDYEIGGPEYNKFVDNDRVHFKGEHDTAGLNGECSVCNILFIDLAEKTSGSIPEGASYVFYNGDADTIYQNIDDYGFQYDYECSAGTLTEAYFNIVFSFDGSVVSVRRELLDGEIMIDTIIEPKGVLVPGTVYYFNYGAEMTYQWLDGEGNVFYSGTSPLENYVVESEVEYSVDESTGVLSFKEITPVESENVEAAEGNTSEAVNANSDKAAADEAKTQNSDTKTEAQENKQASGGFFSKIVNWFKSLFSRGRS